MNKKILLLLFASLMVVGGVFAYDAAYIVTNPNFFEQGYINALQEMNFTVHMIDDSDVAATNLSNYQLVVVGNSHFTNPSVIPVNKYPVIILNSESTADWGFSNQVSQVASTQPLKVVNQVYNPEAAYITRNLPQEPIQAQAYSSCCFTSGTNIPMYYMSRLDVLPALKKVTSTTNNNLDSVVAVRTPGTVMRNGEVAKARGCFFGAVSADYWTPNTKQLFKQCADWVAFGKDGDQDGYYEGVDCNDANPAIHPGAVELNDGIDQNCVNDEPLIMDIPDRSFDEDTSSQVNLSQYITDLDNQFSSLNIQVTGNTNVQTSRVGNVVTLNALQNWNGQETLTIMVKDPSNASVSDSFEVTVNALNDAPVVQDIPDQDVEQFSQFSYTGVCSDVENDQLTFGDDFAKFDINPVTGTMSWVPGENDVGTYAIQVSCSDGTNTVYDSFNLVVRVKNTAPVLNIPAQETNEDTPKVLTLTSFATDGQNDPLTFSVTQQNVSQAVCALSGSVLTITPVANFNGVASCGVVASDGRLNSQESVFLVNVLSINDAPEMDALQNVTVVAGAPVVLAPVVHDMDSSGLTVSVNDAKFTNVNNVFTWQTTYNDAGLYTFIVSVSDGQQQASREVTVEVKPVLLINEVATDPATDRDHDGFLTASDEMIELYNPGSTPVTVVSWKLEMDDATDAQQFINGVLEPHQHFVINNPGGVLDNDGQLRLFDHEGVLVDSVSYGHFNDGDTTDNAPNGNSNDIFDECIARSPDGKDSNVDKDDFIKRPCTPGVSNDQDLFAPQITIIDPANDSVSVDGSLKVNFTAVDNLEVSSCTFMVNNEVIETRTIASASYSGMFTRLGLADNSVATWKVSCVDTSNNTQVTPEQTINVVINDAPLLVLTPVSTPEDTPVMIDLMPLASDADNDPLFFDVVAQDQHKAVCVVSGTTLEIIPKLNWNGETSCTLVASDGSLQSANAVLAITVTPVNDAPTVRPIPNIGTSEDTPVTLKAHLYASDNDSAELSFSTQGFDNILVTQNGSVLTFTPSPDWNGQTSGKLLVSDGEFTTESDEFMLTVTSVNDAPTVNLTEVSVTEDVPLTLNLLDYASDPEQDAIEFSILSQSSHVGCAIDNAVLTLTPAENFNGATSCMIGASDGSSSASTVVAITVVPVNDAPIVGSISNASIEEDGVFELHLETLASDVDGDSLTFTPNGFGAFNVSVTGNMMRFVPSANWNGEDDGIIIVSDGVANVESNSFTITVVPVNDAPVLNLPSANVTEDTPSSIDLALFTSDVENDVLSFEVIGQNASQVGCVLDNSVLTMTPALNVNGAASCGVRVTDSATSTEGVLHITVVPVNDAPVFTSEIPDQFVNEDSSATFDFSSYVSDVDGDSLVYNLTTVKNLTVVITGKNIKVTPDHNYNGADSAHVVISDGHFVIEDDIVITTLPANDMPTITSTPTTSGVQGVQYTYDFNAVDIDNDVLVYSIVKGPPGMSIDNLTGLISFVPGQADVGQFAVTLKVDDQHGGSRIQNYVLVIADVNDAPILNGEVPNFTTPEDVVLSVDLTSYITDPDHNVLQYSVEGFQNMNVQFSGDRATFTPALNWNGQTSGRITARDASQSVTTNMFEVVVTPRNDAPVFTSVPVTDAFEGSLYQYDVNASDVDGDALEYSLVQAPTGMVIDPSSGLITFTPTTADIGQYAVRVKVADASSYNLQVFVLIVSDVDQGPVLTKNIADVSVAEDHEVSMNLSEYFADPDGGTIRYGFEGFSNAVIIIDNDHARLIPIRDWNGITEGKITATSGGSTVKSNLFEVEVIPVNDAPMLDAIDDVTVMEGDTVVITADANDVEDDSISYMIDSAKFTQNDNIFTWETGDDDAGVYHIIITASDGSASTAQEVKVTVLEKVVCEDSDHDYVCNDDDNCPTTPNQDQENNDHDSLGDACDGDDDNDGVSDGSDNCPLVSNANQANHDNDSLGDACDSDDDNDTVEDGDDNCPLDANSDQHDEDDDGIGDACDSNNGGNQAPSIITAPPTTAEVGKEYIYRLVARDPENDKLTYEVSDDRFDREGSTFKFTPKENGAIDVTFTVRDAAGNEVSQDVTITVGKQSKVKEVHSFSMSKAFFYEERVTAGDDAELYVVLKNRGNQEEKRIDIDVSSSELDIYDQVEGIELDRFGSDWSYVVFHVPEDTKPGSYLVKVTAENRYDSDTAYVMLFVE